MNAKQAVLLIVVVASLLAAAGCGAVGPQKAAEPTPEPILVADFDACGPINNLVGNSGAAFNEPDRLVETYPQEPNRGCVARLEWTVEGWAGYWQQLMNADFSRHHSLTFDIRADKENGIPGQIKVELKGDNQRVGVAYVKGIDQDWKTISVPLDAFVYPGYGNRLGRLTDLQELVFVVERNTSGAEGVLFLDNVVIR
jgi:hypothetical protein